jgi:molybdopterin/thiamine biosynthesis adenylyltransferase
MNTEQRQRFKDAPWLPKEGELALVGGAGGIGSWLTYFLAKIGIKVYLYDFDTVEDHNLGGQLFFQKSIGTPKVSAVAEILAEFCDVEIAPINEALTFDTTTHYYAFSAFDNMEARHTLFHLWKKSWPHTPSHITPIFIDGRLEMEQLQVFCVTPATANKYQIEHLFADSNVPDAPCTMKQTSHTAAMIGSLMASFFTNHLTNEYMGEVVRDVPFYYEFMVPMCLTNLEL